MRERYARRGEKAEERRGRRGEFHFRFEVEFWIGGFSAATEEKGGMVMFHFRFNLELPISSFV